MTEDLSTTLSSPSEASRAKFDNDTLEEFQTVKRNINLPSQLLCADFRNIQNIQDLLFFTDIIDISHSLSLARGLKVPKSHRL